MKYHLETVLLQPGASFRTEYNIGPVVDCVFHVHPECELTLVESGFGTRFVGASLEPFSEMDLVLAGGMLPHHYLSCRAESTGEEWSKMRVVKFLPEFCGRDFLELPESAAIKTMLTEAKRGLHVPLKTAKNVYKPLTEMYDLEGLPKILKFLEILEILSHAPLRPLNLVAPEAGDFKPDDRLNQVLNFIHHRLECGRDVCLPEVAAKACMTPPAFSSYFHRATRRGFIEYVIELKLNYATQLLIRTDRSVLDIALESGFTNLSNFNRRFRAAKGMTPGMYRREFRKSTL
ncbi:MAG: AraC family transcriptional regulator [Victivallales bacterium]|jgi:AraC-like DNA-binding protein|nr:AraC family transcriptional regulator [Victivallales bacterium]